MLGRDPVQNLNCAIEQWSESKKEFDQVKPIHLRDLSQKDGFWKIESDSNINYNTAGMK